MGNRTDERGKVLVTLCASLWDYGFSVMFDYLSLLMLRVNKWSCFAENILVMSFGTLGVHNTHTHTYIHTYTDTDTHTHSRHEFLPTVELPVALRSQSSVANTDSPSSIFQFYPHLRHENVKTTLLVCAECRTFSNL